MVIASSFINLVAHSILHNFSWKKHGTDMISILVFGLGNAEESNTEADRIMNFDHSSKNSNSNIFNSTPKFIFTARSSVLTVTLTLAAEILSCEKSSII